jgi:hypothetical protein
MATNRILYNRETLTGAQIAEFVDMAMKTLAKGRRVKAQLDNASTGADWAAVAAEVGGGLTAQQAQDLWTIMSTAVSQIDVAQVMELSRLDQG